MRWINYSLPGGSPSYGILDDERIREVRGSPFGHHDPTGQIHRLVDVRIEVPFVPRTFYAAGLNYVKQPVDTNRGDFEDRTGNSTDINIPQIDLELRFLMPAKRNLR